jgi:AsmA protein
VIAVMGLKRLAVGVAVLIAVGLGALALVPVFLPAERVRDAVQAEINAVTGLQPVLAGDAAVSLFPSARVSLGQVALDANREREAALTAERVIAHLRLLPLLLGRIEIADVTLIRPRIAVTFDADGGSNWSPLIERLSRALKPGAQRSGRTLSFSEIRIADGTVFVHDERRRVSETLADVEMSLAWPSISKSFGATGRFLWRNETVDASIALSDLLAAITGDRSGLKLRLTGTPLKLAFDGHVSHKPALKVEGTLAADAASLRQALRWAGLRSLPGGGLGRFAIRGQANVAGANFSLTGVNLELDGNAAEGVLAFTNDGRPLLQGTLAADTVNVAPYVSTLRLLSQDEREWSSRQISFDGLTGIDLDLRLSAAKVALTGAQIGRTAVAANLRSGRLTLTIGESQAFGGVLKGRVALARSPAGIDLKAQLQFTDVDLENCLGKLVAVRRLEGKGNLTFALEATGASVLALTRTLNGQASVNARQGALAGLNLEHLLKRLERRPLSGTGDFRNGRTPFERLTLALTIVQGKASLDSGRMEGAAVRLAMDGLASIPERDLDLKGTASLVASSNGAAAFELPFVVQGPWDDPILLPDARSLIQRSGAAAPLLDAVRERRGRDAVRSAIETITRLPAPAVSGAPPAAAAPVAPVSTPGQ